MKKNLLLCFVYLVSTLVSAQNYQWEGAVFGHVNSSSSTVYRMAVSKSNQKAVVGQFKGSMQIGNHSLSSDKPLGLFLAKFAENDSLLWLKKILEVEQEDPVIPEYELGTSTNIEFDPFGNIYVGVSYSGTVLIENELFVANDSVPTYNTVDFLKYSEEGSLLDHFRIRGSCTNSLMYDKVTIDDTGQVYLMIFYGNDDFGTTDSCTCIVNNDTLVTDSKEALLIKLSPNFETLWSKRLDLNSVLHIEQVGSSIYLCGNIHYGQNVHFDDYTIPYPSNYNQGAYVAKFDTSGVFKWARHFGVPNWASNIQMRDLHIASPNSIVVMGSAYSQLVPNKIYFENAATLHGNINGSEDAFVVCYDSLGNVKWHEMSNNYGGEWYAKGSSDAAGTVFLGGTYTNDIVFGNDTLETSGGYDVFLRALDAQGQALWSKTITGAGSEFLYDMGTDSQNNLFLMGESSSAGISFGGNSYDLANDYRDFFIARLSPSFLALPERERAAVQVHPNPSSGRFTLRAESSIASVELYSLTGDLLLQQSYTAQNQLLLNTNLSSGAYLLRVLLANGQESVQKLMIN